MKTIILSGGGGSRLWPLSRSRWPKQFLSLGAEHSLLVQTIERIVGLDPSPKALQDILIISNAKLVEPITEDLARCGLSALIPQVISEPVRRNTAPAIGLAAQMALEMEGVAPDEVLVILPADHQIPDRAAFQAHLAQAEALAKEGYIITLGIAPSYPETGYGYIEVDQPYDNAEWLPVTRFVEKPDAATAKTYVDSARFLWNAGIFVLRADTLMASLSAHAPEIAALLALGADEALARFAQMPDISFDYAVMEQARKVAVIPFRATWSDVGCWDSVYDLAAKDERGNAWISDKGVIAEQTDNCLVWNASGRHIGLIGLKDALVVDTPDALLISARGQSQEVKAIVRELERQESVAADFPATETLAWGERLRLNAQSTDTTELPVFRLTMTAGLSLSLEGLDHLHLTVLSGALTRQDAEQKAGSLWHQSPGEAHRLMVSPEGAVVLAVGSKPLIRVLTAPGREAVAGHSVPQGMSRRPEASEPIVPKAFVVE